MTTTAHPRGRNWTAASAAGFFGPAFATVRGATVVRAVLDQARCLPQLTLRVEPSVTERRRLDVSHRVGPLVRRGWPEPEDLRARRDFAIAHTRLRAVTDEAAGWLSEAGIGWRVLKGLATGALDYPEMSLRHTTDVDLLVAPELIEPAEQILVQQGCTPQSGVEFPGSMLKGPTLRHPAGIEIDLHFRFEGMFAMAPAVVFDTVADQTSDGLRALIPELRLIHAAVHAVASIPSQRRLSSVADIVAIIDNTGVDWLEARALADELGVRGLVAEALRMEAAIMDRPQHAGLDWPGLSRPVASALLSPKRNMAFRHLMQLRHLPPDVSPTSYLRAVLAPPEGAISARGGLTGHVRKLSRSLWE